MNEQAEKLREQSDLLEQLIRLQKKELRNARLTALASLVVIVVLVAAGAILVPRAAALLDHIEHSLTDIDTLAAEAGTMLSEAQSTVSQVDSLARNANRVVVDNTEAVKEAMDKLNSVDFQRLNEAVDSLAQAVEPLAKLSSLFH